MHIINLWTNKEYNINMNIDIKKLKDIKEELEKLDKDVAFIDEDGVSKFVILPIEQYEFVEDILQASKDGRGSIRVINANNLELTYDEYESVKKQLDEIIEKTFKPKPEKLN